MHNKLVEVTEPIRFDHFMKDKPGDIAWSDPSPPGMRTVSGSTLTRVRLLYIEMVVHMSDIILFQKLF